MASAKSLKKLVDNILAIAHGIIWRNATITNGGRLRLSFWLYDVPQFEINVVCIVYLIAFIARETD